MKKMNTRSTMACYSFSMIMMVCFLLSLRGQAQQTINGTITHDGLEREYILYIPASYDGHKKVPLLFNFHGYTSSAQGQMFYGDFRPIADKKGFIIVHPQGTIDSTGATHFNVGWGTSTVDDVGFTEALLDEIILQYNINKKRVYSTGMSNGGFMSYQLACQMSDRFAAIASVTGSMTIGTPSICTPSRPVPILEIHGTNDDTVPYDGAPFSEPIKNVLDFWKDFNNTKSSPRIIELPDVTVTDSSTVQYFRYGGGDKEVAVEHYKIDNGGHSWPGSVFDLPTQTTNYDFNASQAVWDFLSQYNIKGKIKNKQNEYKIFPNPARDFFFIKSKNYSRPRTYKLISVRNRVVSRGVITSRKHRVDVSSVRKGLYFLKLGRQIFRVRIK